MKESDDIKRATGNVEAYRAREKALEEELTRETQIVGERFDAPPVIERIAIKLKRGQVSVQFVALGWTAARPAS
jgi:hypothetical protein